MRSEVGLLVCCLVLPALAGPLQSVVERLQSNVGLCDISDVPNALDCIEDVKDSRAVPGTSCHVPATANHTAVYLCHQSGNWIKTGTTALEHRRKRFLAIVGAIAGAISAAVSVAEFVCKFVCGGADPPNTPPVIRCPPWSTMWVPEGKDSVQVTWSAITASDKEDGDITNKARQTYGIEVNSQQRAGSYPIQYEVIDNGNAMVYCSFSIDVKVHSCYPLQYPEHGSLSCSPSRTLWGSQCQLSCDQGYQVQGPDLFQCDESEVWTPSDRPRCQPRECVTLPSVAHGFFTCLGPQEYRGLCLLGCEAGYVARGPVIACQADGSFTTPGRCADSTKPEFPAGCPPDVEAMAKRPGQLTQVTWTAPTATDNSGDVTVTSTSSPGDGFPLGITHVVYTASDAEGNTASCSFRVQVNTVSCPLPNFDTSGKNIMVYTCPHGHVTGAVCDVLCLGGFPHLGAPQIECQLNQTTFPPSAAWAPKDGDNPPECQVLTCPILRAPANGAMACAKWSLGEKCTLSCNEKFDIPVGIMYDPVFVCVSNGGGWDPNITVPDCTEKRDPNKANIPNQFYFYVGDCPDANTTAEIKDLFITTINKSKYKIVCLNVPDCKADRVSVTCGPSTSASGRKKRHAIHGRSVSEILVTFVITFPFGENAAAMRQNITASLQQEATQGFFDLTVGNETLQARDFSSGSTSYDCPEGTTFNYVTTTCAGCSRGTFYNATLGSCQDCARGSYADQGFSLSCSLCPQHSTTNGTGSRSQDDCIPLCRPGHSSPSGLEPCQVCAAGSFQPDFGQTSCLSCPANHSTPSNASASSSSCLALDACLSSPCGNHSCQQGASLGEFICTCQDDWSGVTCQTPPDPCRGHLCQNGATCVRTTDNYTCSCAAGFYGDFCQEPIVDGAYGSFGEWSQCSKTCGGGTRSRGRSCDSPPPGPHGQTCVGPREELQTCNVQACPVCPSLGRPYGVQFNCTENDDVTTCVVTCREGLTFAEPPLDKYQCGRATNYRWNHQTPEFPEGRIPQCSEVKTPTKVEVNATAQYSSCQDIGSGTDAVDQIGTSVQSLDCVSKNICTPDVQMSGCDSVGRKRRSTSNTANVTITLTMTDDGTALDLTSLANNSVPSKAVNYVIRLLSVDASAQSLSNNTNNVLTVTVGGSTLSPVTIHVTGQLSCPAGSRPTEGVCAVCPKGTRQEGQACVLCERGFYQDQSGQTSCQACPDGKTTPSPASTHLSNCSVDVPPSDQGDTEDGTSSQTLAIVLGVVLSVLVLAAVVIPLSIFLLKTRKNRQQVSTSNTDLRVQKAQSYGSTPDMPSRITLPPLSTTQNFLPPLSNTMPSRITLPPLSTTQNFLPPLSGSFTNLPPLSPFPPPYSASDP